MRLKEQRLWDNFKSHLPHDVSAERIENGVGDGTPDVHCKVRGGVGSCWVELKAVDEKQRPSSLMLGKKGLRISQKNWHKNATQYNERVYTLVKYGKKELYFLPGRHSDDVNDLTIEQMQFCAIARTWTEIFNIIRGGHIED